MTYSKNTTVTMRFPITADYDSEIWGEVMWYIERDCTLIKEMELKSGIATIYGTDVVNEFLVRFERDKGGKNFLFWKKESTSGIAAN